MKTFAKKNSPRKLLFNNFFQIRNFKPAFLLALFFYRFLCFQFIKCSPYSREHLYFFPKEVETRARPPATACAATPLISCREPSIFYKNMVFIQLPDFFDHCEDILLRPCYDKPKTGLFYRNRKL